MLIGRIHRLAGIGLLAVGLWIVLTPMWAGEWALSLLALPMFAAGAIKLASTFKTGLPLRASWPDYAKGLLLIGLVPFLLAAPGLAIKNIKTLLTIYLLFLAALSAVEMFRNRHGSGYINDMVTAVAALALALFISTLGPNKSIVLVGLTVGFVVIATGWRMTFQPDVVEIAPETGLSDRHIDAALGLSGNPIFIELHERITSNKIGRAHV